jgi:hypothetical protein
MPGQRQRILSASTATMAISFHEPIAATKNESSVNTGDTWSLDFVPREVGRRLATRSRLMHDMNNYEIRAECEGFVEITPSAF